MSIKRPDRRPAYGFKLIGALITVSLMAMSAYLPGSAGVRAERSPKGERLYSAPLACAPVSFSNATPITVPAGDPDTATPYPSIINVSGLPGNIVTAPGGIEVTLNSFSHTFPDDLGIVLVGPTGAAFLLQDGAGDEPDVINVTYKLSDLGTENLPDTEAWAAGTYKPTSWYDPGGTEFPAPGPGLVHQSPGPAGGASATFSSVFGDTAPNGPWSLYVYDFGEVDGGEFAGGWTLTITTEGCAAPSPTPTPTPTPTATPTPVPTWSVSGVVSSPDGRGLRSASVLLIDSEGVTRSLVTGTLGFYEFTGLESGRTYTISVRSKRFRFSSRTIEVTGNTTVNFVGLE